MSLVIVIVTCHFSLVIVIVTCHCLSQSDGSQTRKPCGNQNQDSLNYYAHRVDLDPNCEKMGELAYRRQTAQNAFLVKSALKAIEDNAEVGITAAMFYRLLLSVVPKKVQVEQENRLAAMEDTSMKSKLAIMGQVSFVKQDGYGINIKEAKQHIIRKGRLGDGLARLRNHPKPDPQPAEGDFDPCKAEMARFGRIYTNQQKAANKGGGGQTANNNRAPNNNNNNKGGGKPQERLFS